MRGIAARAAKAAVGPALLCTGLGACNGLGPSARGPALGVASFAPIASVSPVAFVSDAERDCLGRAMYFESRRDDEAGLLAVGTVVMNRVEAEGASDGRICDVVGRPGQFAAGVLTKPMQPRDLQRVADVADAVLAGERHPGVGRAMHFHTAGRRYPYGNMHYVAVAGGNAFYEKRRTAERTRPTALLAAADEAPAREVASPADVLAATAPAQAAAPEANSP